MESFSKSNSHIHHPVFAQVNEVLAEVLDNYDFNQIRVALFQLTEIAKDALNHANESLSIVVPIAFFKKLHLFNEPC